MKLLMTAGVILSLAVSSGAQQVQLLGESEPAVQDQGDKMGEVPLLPGSEVPAAAREAEKDSAVKKSTGTVIIKKRGKKAAAVPVSAPVPAQPAESKSPETKKGSGPALLEPEISKATAAVIVIKPAEDVPVSARPEAEKEAGKPAPAALPAKAAAAKAIVPALPEAEKEPVPAVTEGGFSVTKKHEVVKGETLWDLSNKYYGDPFMWGRIYNANIDKISNPDRIYPKNEIEIPEITEIVKPAPLPVPEVKEAVTPSALSAPEEMAELPAEEAAVAAKEVSTPIPAAAKAGASDYELTDLSMEMPVDQKEWSAGRATIVPENWKEAGVIISRMNSGADDENDSLATSGDRVRIKVEDPSLFRPGELISVYMKGAAAYEKKTNKKLGLELQKTGVLEVLSVDNNIVKARVIESNTSVDRGQVIKK